MKKSIFISILGLLLPLFSFAQAIQKDTIFYIHFDYGKHDFSPNAESELQTLTYFLKDLPDVRWTHVRILGHTDNKSSKAFNEALSLKRANAVRNYLLKVMPPKADLIEVSAWDYSKPLMENTTEENRALNRRVEVRVKYEGLDKIVVPIAEKPKNEGVIVDVKPEKKEEKKENKPPIVLPAPEKPWDTSEVYANIQSKFSVECGCKQKIHLRSDFGTTIDIAPLNCKSRELQTIDFEIDENLAYQQILHTNATTYDEKNQLLESAGMICVRFNINNPDSAPSGGQLMTIFLPFPEPIEGMNPYVALDNSASWSDMRWRQDTSSIKLKYNKVKKGYEITLFLGRVNGGRTCLNCDKPKACIPTKENNNCEYLIAKFRTPQNQFLSAIYPQGSISNLIPIAKKDLKVKSRLTGKERNVVYNDKKYAYYLLPTPFDNQIITLRSNQGTKSLNAAYTIFNDSQKLDEAKRKELKQLNLKTRKRNYRLRQFSASKVIKPHFRLQRN